MIDPRSPLVAASGPGDARTRVPQFPPQLLAPQLPISPRGHSACVTPARSDATQPRFTNLALVRARLGELVAGHLGVQRDSNAVL